MKIWTEEEFLDNSVWYHTTEREFANNIKENGVIASINATTELDFGYGFYLTPSLEWSKKYAEGYRDPVILEYHFTPRALLGGDNNYAFFQELNDTFAEFVFNNRMYYEEYEDNCIHDYLLVGGVMSDGDQPVDFERYRSEKITKEELFRRLCIPKEDWQLVIHSQDLCSKLRVFDTLEVKGGE